MPPLAVLRAATSGHAKKFRREKEMGPIQAGLLADIVAVEGDPTQNITALRKIRMVMKEGILYKTPQ